VYLGISGLGGVGVIKIYSAKWCSGCTQLKKLLSSKEVPFTEVDIDTIEGMQEAKTLNIKGIPTSIIGDKIFVGSKQEIIEAILEAVNDQNNNTN
jgi:glutaredoxin